MGARTPILEEMHLWVLLAYSSALFVLAGACWLGARLVRRATERQDSLEAEQAKKGEYMPWATVRSVASSAPATPWRPRLEAALEVATWTLAWWGMSVTFTLVNKYFLGYWRPPVRHGQTVAPGFPFAVTTTTMHLSMKVLLSTATVKWRSRRLERRLASDEASHAEATATMTRTAGTTSMPMNKNPSMRTAKARLRQLAALSSATGSASPYWSFMTQD